MMLENTQNIIHQLFFDLGVDLDYIPTQKYEAFTMGLQFVAALWFLHWFCKWLWSLVKDTMFGGR